MAVLDAFPGLTTEIIVNKVPLAKFHDDETEASPTENTKYIEARSGSEFMIRTTFSEPFPTVHGVEISVRVDGNPGPLSAVKPDDQLYLDSTEIKGVSFSQDGKRYRQNYQFAELHIVEQPEEPIDLNVIQKELQLKRCIEAFYRFVSNFSVHVMPKLRSDTAKAVTPEDGRSIASISWQQLPIIGVVPEKASKGDTRSHQAILGEPKIKKVAAEPRSAYSYKYVDRKPFATMRFKYRSLAALKALRIVADIAPESDFGPSQRVEQRITRSMSKQMAQPISVLGKRDRGVKPETGALRHVKPGVNDEKDAQGDPKDLAIVEIRSCKRPRAGHDVIVLD